MLSLAALRCSGLILISPWLYALISNSNTVNLTTSDRDLIVAEMKSEQKLHNLKMMALQRGLIV